MQTPRRVRTAGNRACEHAGFSRCGVTVGSRSRDVGSMEMVQGVRSVQTPLRGAGCCVTPGPGAGSGARRCRRLPRGPPGGAGAGCCPNTSPARVRPAARAALGVCAVGPRLLQADPPLPRRHVASRRWPRGVRSAALAAPASAVPPRESARPIRVSGIGRRGRKPPAVDPSRPRPGDPPFSCSLLFCGEKQSPSLASQVLSSLKRCGPALASGRPAPSLPRRPRWPLGRGAATLPPRYRCRLSSSGV